MSQTQYLLCFKHMIRYVSNTLFTRLRRHSPVMFQMRYLMCFRKHSSLCVTHISLLCVRHITCYVVNTMYLLWLDRIICYVLHTPYLLCFSDSTRIFQTHRWLCFETISVMLYTHDVQWSDRICLICDFKWFESIF